MIGTGGQAAAQLEAMLAARKLEEVKIFDLNEERCKAFAEEMQKEQAKYGANNHTGKRIRMTVSKMQI